MGRDAHRNVIRAVEDETSRREARFRAPGRVGISVDGNTGSLSGGWTEDGQGAGAGR